jgi:ATP-dependent RNA helicase DeaD
VALSVGRAQNAEPRWLIPMLCKAGNINKRQLGSIRIQQSETHVEIDAGSIERFLAEIGARGQLEKGIRVRRIAAPAHAPAQQRTERAPPRATKPGKPHRAGYDPARADTRSVRKKKRRPD